MPFSNHLTPEESTATPYWTDDTAREVVAPMTAADMLLMEPDQRTSLGEAAEALAGLAIQTQASEVMPWGEQIPADLTGLGLVEVIAAHRAGLPEATEASTSE